MTAQPHGEYWFLADAKNRLSKLARLSVSQGPQKISRREGNIVVISEQEYLALTGEEVNFKRFLLESTPAMTELDLTRDKSCMRKVIL